MAMQAVDTAIRRSNLGNLPADVIRALTAGAETMRIPAGSTIHREGETQPHLELVLRGLVRAYVSSVDGRTFTVRYCRPGALIGVATLYAPALSTAFAIQAVTDAEILRLRPRLVVQYADRDPRVARALLRETSDRVLSFVSELAGTAFATVRQRIGRHLLDLASERQRGAELVAEVTQQQLADAVGTVREVVVRELRELREEGVVATGRHGITILDAERLLAGA